MENYLWFGLWSAKGDAFNANFTSTIGVDFEIKSLRADGKRVNHQIWVRDKKHAN